MRDEWRIDNPPKEEESYLIQLKSGYLLICKWSNRSYFGGNLLYNDDWRWINLPQYTLQEDVEAWRPLPARYDGRLTPKYVIYDRSISNKMVAKCPGCMHVFVEENDDLWGVDFCFNCGQKLEW